ncbi:MAG: EVE domain-containing protein [Gemmatimonadetes bacterium]|nr:MAG: EVE domain-containing protein [Gemmatimonadota bacterium]
MATKYWLMKSEPDCFSFDDLKNSPHSTTHWDGVRNYQARNFMRDEMQVGDLILFYHSSCKPAGIVGIAEVVRAGYPDHTAWDPNSDHFDPKASPENPRWYMVDIRWKEKFPKMVTLQALKANLELANMKVVQRGQRLSVQPVTPEEFQMVYDMGRGNG